MLLLLLSPSRNCAVGIYAAATADDANNAARYCRRHLARAGVLEFLDCFTVVKCPPSTCRLEPVCHASFMSSSSAHQPSNVVVVVERKRCGCPFLSAQRTNFIAVIRCTSQRIVFKEASKAVSKNDIIATFLRRHVASCPARTAARVQCMQAKQQRDDSRVGCTVQYQQH